MKSAVYGIMLSVLGILVVFIIMTVNGRMTRQKEATDALGQCVETAVENTIESDNYTIENNEEFVADFMENLLNQIENDADIEVKIAGIDYKKGLLSVEVIEHYIHPAGKPGEVRYQTTVILEQAEAEKYHSVEFYDANGNLLKTYTLKTGTKVVTPSSLDTDRSIAGWINESGQSVDPSSYKVMDSDLKFYAIYS